MFESLSYLSLGVLCAVALLVLRHVTTSITNRRFAAANGCEPPIKLPQSDRILGVGNFREALQLHKSKRILPHGLQRFRSLGYTYELVAMGQQIVVTVEPQNVQTVLATKFKDYGLGGRMAAFGPLLGSGIFTSDGAAWEHSRALVRPSFTKDRVANLDSFETHIQHMIAKIPKDGSSVDLQTLFFQLTLDSATEFLLGTSINSLTSAEGSVQANFGKAFDAAQNQLPDRMRLGPFAWLHRNKTFTDSCKFVHDYVDTFVQRALQQESQVEDLAEKGGQEDRKAYIFVNELAKATKDPIQIRSELLNLLLAGRDTTAGLLSNTFYVLARRPDIWQKLKQEIRELNGAKPDYTTLRNLTYLRYVLKESLRQFPSVPNNARFANKNTVLPVGGGSDGQSPIFVPKGAIVAWSVFSMHRRKDLYGEDADEYNPERWEKLRVGWEYLPFNGGPRVCLGQNYALTEAGYTTVRLVQEFERIESADSKDWLEGLHLTLSSGNGVHVKMYAEN